MGLKGSLKEIPRSGLAKASNGPVPRSPSVSIRGGGAKAQGHIEVSEPRPPGPKHPGLGSTPPKVASAGKALRGHNSNDTPPTEKKSSLPPSHSLPVERSEIGGLKRGRVRPKGNSETISKGKLPSAVKKGSKGGELRSFNSKQSGVKKGGGVKRG